MSADSEFDFLFEGLDDEPEPEHTDVVGTAEQAAEAQERALLAEADRYEAMLPAIQAAQPLPAQPTEASAAPRLSGAEWVTEGVRQALVPKDPTRYSVKADVVGDSVVAWVTGPVGVDRDAMARHAVRRLRDRGNLGEFQVHLGSDPRTVILQRSGVGGSVSAWSSHGTRARNFFEGEAGRDKVFDLAGHYQTNKRTKVRRYPGVRTFGEDHRGGTATLRLRPGMTLAQVKAAEGKLRQLFRAPDLVVDSAPGSVDPIIHLNSKPLRRELPKAAAMRIEMFTRARTEVEMYAAAGDFTLPIGVRTEPETGRTVELTARFDVQPHGACFGPTGSGKTVWLASAVRAAAVQGCADTMLWDAKEGSDLRELALDRTIPGIVHYASGDSVNGALLHRAVLFMRDEFDRRKQVARKLAYRGIKYRPRPLFIVMDELPAWIIDQKKMGGDRKKAAELTEARLNYMASQARELRITFLVAGQTAYVEGYPGMIRANTRNLVLLGEPETVNINALFPGREREALELANTITPEDRGVGVVMDPDVRVPALFRGFFNAPGSPAAVRFDAALRDAPRKRRWAYRLPHGDEPGADGSWIQWHPLSEPSSDSLVAQYLDDENFQPYEERRRDDPTDPRYDPGTPPAPARHLI